MAQFVDPNELLYNSWEPKLNNRFVFRIDGIPTYLIKKASRPTIESTEIELPHINTRRFAKGKTNWSGTMSLELYDPITPSGAQIVMEWVRLSHETVTGRDGYLDMFKRDVSLDILGPVGDIVENWTLKGAWVKTATFGDLDYAGGEAMMISLDLQYDQAILNY